MSGLNSLIKRWTQPKREEKDTVGVAEVLPPCTTDDASPEFIDTLKLTIDKVFERCQEKGKIGYEDAQKLYSILSSGVVSQTQFKKLQNYLEDKRREVNRAIAIVECNRILLDPEYKGKEFEEKAAAAMQGVAAQSNGGYINTHLNPPTIKSLKELYGLRNTVPGRWYEYK